MAEYPVMSNSQGTYVQIEQKNNCIIVFVFLQFPNNK